jgi:cholesterol transport system auxiliary component
VRTPTSIAILALVLTSCTAVLKPAKAEPVTLHALEVFLDGRGGAINSPTLLVNAPRAHPGFEGPRMAYVRQAHEIEYFTRNQWVDSPARMLAPLLVQALERSGSFRAVVPAPSGALADVRLDTEIVRLQQEFAAKPPSRVRFTLRAQLLDLAARRALPAAELEAVEDARSDDPRGGAEAASRAVARVLRQLADHCADQVSGLGPGAPAR